MFLALTVAVCVSIALIGCFYCLGAAVAVRSFRRRVASTCAEQGPAVTILKPLHGAEPGLYDALRSFLDQDFTGQVQYVFGIGDATDTARPVVERLIGEFPQHDIALVIGFRQPQSNGKIINLACMSEAIKHDVIVLSDSDIRVARDYLRRTCDALAVDDVGLVTCLYQGGSDRSLWSTLSSMAIDFHFFPSVLVGVRMAKASPCMGATMAFTRDTLARIGGFEAFAGHLADDYAIGKAIRALGLEVAIAPHTVVHQCNERSAANLFFHELRWARTIRSIDPRGFAGSFVTHPLPFALAAATLGSWTVAVTGVLLLTILCRAMVQWQVERSMGKSTRRWVLGPLRDVLSFAVFCSSFVTDVVVWRGRRYRVLADGTMEELKGLTS